MKKLTLTAVILILILGTLVCILGFRRQTQEEACWPQPGAEAMAVPAEATAAPEAPRPAPSPTPVPAPVVENPAQTAQMAWDALFEYPTHEAPIRVLALLKRTGSPGDAFYRQMLSEGKLMPKGVCYADQEADAAAWVANALKSIPVGLLDSIYAEDTALAMAAYKALREANRNDSVEVICAGITQEVIAAMQEDRFSMGAAAGVYENELRVVYAEEFMQK